MEQPASASPPDGSFGALLRAFRHRACLSQEQLAARAELSERAVRNLEAGRVRSPRNNTVRLLADALALAEPEQQRWVAAVQGADPRQVEAGPPGTGAGAPARDYRRPHPGRSGPLRPGDYLADRRAGPDPPGGALRPDYACDPCKSQASEIRNEKWHDNRAAEPTHAPFRRRNSKMRARIHVITLAVADLERALEFYRGGLGLQSPGVVGTEFAGDDTSPAGAVVMFQLQGGLILALYPRTELAKDANIPLGPPQAGEFTRKFLLTDDGSGTISSPTSQPRTAQMTSSSSSLTAFGWPDHRPDIFPALITRPRSASSRCNFAGLPDAAIGGRQPQVPPHLASPFHRSAARCCPAAQASSTCVPWTWM